MLILLSVIAPVEKWNKSQGKKKKTKKKIKENNRLGGGGGVFSARPPHLVWISFISIQFLCRTLGLYVST